MTWRGWSESAAAATPPTTWASSKLVVRTSGDRTHGYTGDGFPLKHFELVDWIVIDAKRCKAAMSTPAHPETRRFTRGLGKPGTAAELRQSVSEVVRTSVLVVSTHLLLHLNTSSVSWGVIMPVWTSVELRITCFYAYFTQKISQLTLDQLSTCGISGWKSCRLCCVCGSDLQMWQWVMWREWMRVCHKLNFCL